MFHPAAIVHPRRLPQKMQEELLGLLLGCAFTLALFAAVARLEEIGEIHSAPEIEDLRRAAVMIDPPPPPPPLLQPLETAPADLPLSGLEIGASDSPVKLAVVPPDLETVIPTRAYVPARVPLSTLHLDLKPSMSVDVDVNRVYQESEVDQKPRALIRTAPAISSDIQRGAASLRVGLLLLIDTKGKVTSARVLQSSGNAGFDDAVARCVMSEWLFSPALRRGKKVRVLAEQGFRVNFGGHGSPFSVDG